MPLVKTVLECRAADGLAQKFDPLSLPMGKAAKAINLEKTKQGSLSKRLGFFPLATTDPFGSTFVLNAGVSLGVWNDGSIDNLISVGRGNRPNTSSCAATVLQTYSDDLSGPVNRGYAPDIKVVQDTVSSTSYGTAFSPCGVTIGDVHVTVWIDPSGDFQNPSGSARAVQPLGPVGLLLWNAVQVSTGQTIVGTSVVDSVGGQYVQYFRLANVSGNWLVCYSSAGLQANSTAFNGMIMAKTMSAVTAGWSPGPNTQGTIIVGGGGQPADAAVPNPYGTQSSNALPTVGFPPSNNTSIPAPAFDMKAVIGDPGYFVIAYETGVWTPPHGAGDAFVAGFWSGNEIVVDRRNISAPQTIVATWNVQAAPAGLSVVGGFGVRATNSSVGVALSWSYAGLGGGYTEYAALGTYPAMTTFNTPTIIYQSQDGNEIIPSWCDVSYSSTTGVYTTTHSPMGSCWNAALTCQNAVHAGGSGASGTVSSLNGRVIGIPVKDGGAYSNQTSGPSVYFTPQGSPAALYYPQTGSTNNMSGPTFVSVTAATPQGTFPSPAGEGGGFGSAPKVAFGGGSPFDSSHVGSLGDPQMLYSVNTGAGSVTINDGGAGYETNDTPAIVFGNGDGGTGAAATCGIAYSGGPISNFLITSAGSGYKTPPIVTIRDRAGTGSGAQVTVSAGGSTGAIGNAVIVSGGSNYTGPIDVFFSGGATAGATVTNGKVTAINITNGGQNYPSAPSITIVDPPRLVGLQQQEKNRVIQTGLDIDNNPWTYPSNDARIIQNQWFVGSSGQPLGLMTATCQGNSSGIGNAAITPGVVLASNVLEINGTAYFLGWVPSATQGSFVILASDIACSVPSGALTGNGYPMRPVGLLQTRTALADPGWGYQKNPLPAHSLDINGVVTVPQLGVQGWVYQAPTAPNCWTGGTWWSQSGSAYEDCYVSYVSSSNGGRLSPAYAQIQAAPRQGYQSAACGNTTAISGALTSLFDGQNVIEQGFIYTPEGILAQISSANTSIATNAALTWASVTDSYSWIFQWEHFDAQGNLHRSPRAIVTITGQNIIDALGPGTPATPTFNLPFSGCVKFTVPSLGVTNRAWPSTTNPGDFGNDIRSLCQRPSSPVYLGVYRTVLNGQVYYRVYDRFYNGDDIGDSGFTLPPIATNTLGAGCIVTYTDGLADTFLSGTNVSYPFPLLYGDGTNGVPGNLDEYCPPSSAAICKHKERLFIANGSTVRFTKQRAELVGPGYNDQLFVIFVGGDDPITGLASLDDKLIIFKRRSIYYVAGDGPNDDGSGNSFTPPQPLPTDAGCVNPQSVISTPEGVYFQSDAGLRIVTRSLAVEYCGGPVEDELSTYPQVQSAVLYPSNNRTILLANSSDLPAAAGPNSGQLNGECLVRDYVLDAWTTTFVTNGTQTPGFASAAVAWGNGQSYIVHGLPFHQPPQLRLHLIGADGQIWREHDAKDQTAYYDNNTYVSSQWVSPWIRPSDSYQGRFRCWDALALFRSHDAHGLLVSVAIDYGSLGQTRTWVWNSATGAPSIAPGGVSPTPMGQLRLYDGRLAEAFQFSIQDVADPASTTGEGCDIIGLSLTLGTYPSTYRLSPGQTQ